MADDKFTRRNFLHDSTSGVLGSLCLPSLATLLHSKLAFGASNKCPVMGSNNMPAFIAVDLDGGASIAGNNVIVYDEGGNLLENYQGLGLPNSVNPRTVENMIDRSIGLPMHKHSAMLKGIKSVAAAEVLAKTNGVVICTRTADDTNKNELATAPGVFAAGSKGLYIPLLGSEEGNSGGKSISPFNSGVMPVKISSISSAKQIITSGSVWHSHPAKMKKVLDAINQMSSSQLEKFSQLGLSDQAKTMIECGYLNANDLLNTPANTNFDPNLDSQLSSHISKMTAAGEIALAISYLVIKGYAGSGTVRLPDYDYHDGSASTADSKDFQAGQTIGMMLQMAASLQRKLMIHVYTDGGVDPIIVPKDCKQATTDPTCEATANGGTEKFRWGGDSEVRSAAFVLVYDPSGRSPLSFSASERQQLGAYKSDDNGTLNLSPSRHAKISTSPRAQAQIVVANWLAWQGQEDKIFTAMSDTPVNASELDDYLFMSSS